MHSRSFQLSVLFASVVSFPGLAFSQSRFVVSTATTVMNGLATNTINGDDELLVTSTGAIRLPDMTAVMGTGNDNKFLNAGAIEGYVQFIGDRNFVDNSAEIKNAGTGGRTGIDLRTENDAATPKTYSVGSWFYNRAGGRVVVDSLDSSVTGVQIGIRSRIINERNATILVRSATAAGIANAHGLYIGADTDPIDNDIMGADVPVVENAGTILATTTGRTAAIGIRGIVALNLINTGTIQAVTTTGQTAGALILDGVGKNSRIVNDVGGSILVRSGVGTSGAGVFGIQSEGGQSDLEVINRGLMDIYAAPGTSGTVRGISVNGNNPRVYLTKGSRTRIATGLGTGVNGFFFQPSDPKSSASLLIEEDAVLEMISGGSSTGVAFNGGSWNSFTLNGSVTLNQEGNMALFGIVDSNENLKINLGSSGSYSVSSGGTGTINLISAGGRRADLMIGGSLRATGRASGSVEIANMGGSDSTLTVTSSGILSAISEGTGSVLAIRANGQRANLMIGGSLEAINRSSGAVELVSMGGSDSTLTVTSSGILSATSEGAGSVWAVRALNLGADLTIGGSVLATSRTTGNLETIGLGGADSRLTVTSSGMVDAVKQGAGIAYTVNAQANLVSIDNSGTLALSLLSDSSNVPSVNGSTVNFTAAATNGRLTNSGTIMSTRTAVSLNGANFEVVNTGLISASGVSTISISEVGSITNRGEINNGLRGGCVICSTAADRRLTLINSGKLIGSVDRGTAALRLAGPVDLTLSQRSSVIGAMTLNGTGNRITIDARGRSGGHWMFNGTGSIEGGRPTVQLDSNQVALYSTNGREVLVLDNKQVNQASLAVANISQDAWMVLKARRFELTRSSASAVWASVFGSQDGQMGEADTNLFSGDSNKGVVLGLDGRKGKDSQWTAGLMVGYAKGKLRLNDSIGSLALEKSTSGAFGAIHGMGRFGKFFVQAAVMGGSLSQDDMLHVSDNMVETGRRDVSLSYSNYWVAPELTIGTTLNTGKWTVTPSLHGSYIYAQIPAYQNTGSPLTMSYGERDASVITGRAELELSGALGSANIGAFGGYQYVKSVSEESVSVSFGNNTAMLRSDSVDRTGFYGGANILLSLAQGASFNIAGKMFYASDDDMDVRGTTGLSVRF